MDNGKPREGQLCRLVIDGYASDGAGVARLDGIVVQPGETLSYWKLIGRPTYRTHEAWHVVQQLAGRVEPTTEVGGMPVNDNIDLEHEADVMGARANGL